MKYFVTYGDEAYEKSKARIVAEAIATGEFDEVISYNKKDLDPHFLSAPLFQYGKGGGYFIWKPYVVGKTLDRMAEGDTLVYADCGCSLFRNGEWGRYFHQVRKRDGLFFLLPLTVEAYTRKAVLQHYSSIGRYWKNRYQISATFFLLRKTAHSVALVDEWTKTMVKFPELVVDVPEEAMAGESPNFVENRYDQSILSALVYKYEKRCRFKILFHHFEGLDRFRAQAVVATRISDTGARGGNKRPFLKNVLYYMLALPYRHLYQKIWSLRR